MNIKEDAQFDALGFGEVMLRLSPPAKDRISQGNTFVKKAGGSELNVVTGISLLGLRTGIITKLPDNLLGRFVKNKVRFYGVSDDYIVFDEAKNSRLGLYYYESGAYPRKPTVVYDRANSSVCSIDASEIDDSMYLETKLFHVSGITIALSENTKKVALEMIKRFKKNGVLVSFDVNFRANLWSEAEARETILPLLQYIDVLFISEETFRKMMQRDGELRDIMKEFAETYDLKIVATSKREIVSHTEHTFGSLIYDAEKGTFHEEKPYERIQVVDRIGSGDAFVAGALFALLKFGDAQRCVEFGNAMAAVKNTVPGDLPACDYDEIESVIKAHKFGTGPEMNR